MNIFESLATFAKKDFTNFSMSNNWIGSINGFGALTPIYQDIVIASDTWKMSHNVMVKLPPLVAPSFTRIKAVINTFYVSYASVWKHWNSFISDKPDDVFLNRSLLKGYKGRFIEPFTDMAIIAYICKIAKGNFVNNDFNSAQTILGKSYFIFPSVYNADKTYTNLDVSNLYYKSITWTIENGLRRAVVANSGEYSDSDFIVDTLQFSTLDLRTIFPSESAEVATWRSLGFLDRISYVIYLCQSCVRNLEAMGVPCDLIARSPLSFYQGQKFNLLPNICLSSIWQNMFRDEQNQSPEFDYSEVNGELELNRLDSRSGWSIRLNGLPLNSGSTAPLFFNIDSMSKAFSVLTGYQLRDRVRDSLSIIDTDNISVLPSHYNGLLLTKYRNFEKDYFTSACVDPMLGSVSVQTPSTIEALRTASKLEEFLERSASARDFYNFMKYNFGTNPESTRYKKPLLLGTKIIPIQISEQLQTSETANTPLGERAGVADGYGNGGTCDHYFNEHGHIFSLLSFVLDSQYMQGLPYQFSHHLQLDYPFPDFANLGAESIPTNEIYFGSFDSLNFNPYNSESRVTSYNPTAGTGFSALELSQNPSQEGEYSDLSITNDVKKGLGASSGDVSARPAFNPIDVSDTNIVNNKLSVDFVQGESKIFGYVPRYSRWKWHNDVVCGQMRNELEFWHTFRKFSQVPYIGHNFVSYEDAGFVSDLNRIFAVENDNSDKFYLDIFNNCSVRRCLPLVANPQIN